jgi:GTP-binding protein HflX
VNVSRRKSASPSPANKRRRPRDAARDGRGRGEAPEERTRRERDRGWAVRREPERAVLVGVALAPATRRSADEHLDELELLSRTAGAEPVGRVIQERDEPDACTFIGKGKVEELADQCERTGANLVIFDDVLAPAQGRNLEKTLQLNVIDRTELILDIFARHARTREAKLQVELAQLQYMRPRLKSLWDHLSRQSGGIGTRGPGETQLEVDRRRVGEKIAHLKSQLAERRTAAKTQRRSRQGSFACALVGYTNAGKSSLMNALAGTDLVAENKLFSTLDATTRRVTLWPGEPVLISDTVGFIRKLPHDLVASFRTTLEEINQADLILHVVDITSAALAAHIDTVNEVLSELLDGPRDTLMVFNKMDALDDRGLATVMLRHHPRARFISARSGEGVAELRHAIQEYVAGRTVEIEIALQRRVPELLSFCYREGRVTRQDQTADGHVLLAVRFPDVAFRRLRKQFEGDYEITGAPRPHA